MYVCVICVRVYVVCAVCVYVCVRALVHVVWVHMCTCVRTCVREHISVFVSAESFVPWW